ncbi:hypothetical protein [Agrobacterium radiobacter]|uniref:hypothetical protein n=1 Tax=Agrobacterium radiobacter TaxID=362 RepID=UPI003CE5743F
MKKITTTIAALFLTTSLVGPAAANDDLIRLGVGLGAALLGEAMKGGGNNRQAQPRKGDKLEGRVDGKPTRQGSQQTAKGKSKPQSEEAEKAEWAARFPIPAVGPVVETKPTPEQMTAWLAAAPEREAQDEAAEAEMAAGPVVATDATTTAAVETASASQPEEASIEITDENGKSWGMVTPTQQAKANEFGALGMGLSDSYRAIGLKGPVEQRVEAEGIDLIDENGVLWGSVPDEVADRVWKAVDLGMRPSEAIPAIAKLQHPDAVKAKAVADAAAATAEEEKTLASCIKRSVDNAMSPIQIADIKYVECRPYEAQITAAVAKALADRKDAEDFANMLAGKGDQQPVETPAVTEAEKDALFDKPASEKQTAAAPAVEEQKPAIDEGETAAIEGDPKPAEQQPVKIKPKKLDL